jgi:hypothetical protein
VPRPSTWILDLHVKQEGEVVPIDGASLFA